MVSLRAPQARPSRTNSLKPRVVSLVVFTGWIGLYLAPGHLHPVLAFTAGFDIHLTKPIEPGRLHDVLADATWRRSG